MSNQMLARSGRLHKKIEVLSGSGSYHDNPVKARSRLVFSDQCMFGVFRHAFEMFNHSLIVKKGEENLNI